MKKSDGTALVTIIVTLALVAVVLVIGMKYIPITSLPAAAHNGEPVKVVFKIKAPDAETVFIAGSFNHWNVDDYPLQKDERGIWEATVLIPPGRYEYKFLVDGDWIHDKNNPAKVPVPAPFWGVNSIIVVR
jgi:1,4-alpha-glucan branching enzyme